MPIGPVVKRPTGKMPKSIGIYLPRGLKVIVK